MKRSDPARPPRIVASAAGSVQSAWASRYPRRGGMRLLDRLRQAIRTRHYSYRTEQAYVDWIRRFIHFHGKRHPQELGAKEVGDFLSHLAVDRQVAASTQTQARSALLFLYRPGPRRPASLAGRGRHRPDAEKAAGRADADRSAASCCSR